MEIPVFFILLISNFLAALILLFLQRTLGFFGFFAAVFINAIIEYVFLMMNGA